MAVSRQKKEEILAELVKLFAEAKSVSFGQYAGLSVEKMQVMRREMRAENVQFKVAKKTLLKLAAKENGMELPDEIMEGTVGAAFSFDDVVAGPKLLKKTAKAEKDIVKLLGGVMDGKVMTITQMNELADLPSKETLLAQFMGMMQAPLRSFHGALSAPLSSMARALTAYSELSENAAPEAPAEEVKEEAPTEVAKEETPVAEVETPAESAPAEEASPAEAAPAEEAPAAADESADA
jgi:large subunit ribosomal protein L10